MSHGPAKGKGRGGPAKGSKPSQRARGPKPGSPPLAERVKIIVGVMTAPPGEDGWTAAKAVELSGKWGVSMSTVQTSSAEASRIVRGAMGSREDIAQALVSRLDRAVLMGEAQGDVKGITGALMAQAKLLGLEAPQKVAMTKADGSDLSLWPEHMREAMATGDGPLIAWLIGLGRIPSVQEIEGWKAARPG